MSLRRDAAGATGRLASVGELAGFRLAARGGRAPVARVLAVREAGGVRGFFDKEGSET
jgi:hypothetical protein